MDESLAIAKELGHRAEIAQYSSWSAEARMWSGDYDGAYPFVQAALALSQEIKSGWHEALALLDAGTLALLSGRLDDVVAPLRASLLVSLPQRQGRANIWCVFYAVANLGAHAAAVGQWQRAARLLGAVDAFLRPTGTQGQGPQLLELLERSRVAAQEHLSPEAFAAAWADGQAMTIAQAGEYALTDETEPRTPHDNPLPAPSLPKDGEKQPAADIRKITL